MLGCHPRSSDHHADTQRCGVRSAQHRHDSSGCHSATLVHCDDGEHTHGKRGCHPATTKHRDDHDTDVTTCPARGPVHHNHDRLGCHPALTQHCHTGQHAHNGGSCHPIGTDMCPLGEHEHLTEHGEGCHPTGRDHYKPKPPGYWAGISVPVLESLLCGTAIGVGVAATGLTGGAGAAIAGAGATAACSGVIAAFKTADEREKFRMIEEAKRRHDAMVNRKNSQDRPSGTNTPDRPMPGTTPKQTPTPTTAPPTTTPKPLTNADLAKANRDYHAGRITPEEMEAIKARYRCQLGIQSYC